MEHHTAVWRTFDALKLIQSPFPINDTQDKLIRAIVISLFTWKRAKNDDTLPGQERMGWWGDSFTNHQIGSHLWLLAREKLTPSTLLRAQEYVHEALQWLVDDGIVEQIAVKASRESNDQLNIEVTFHHHTLPQTGVRFSNIREALQMG